VLIITLFYSFRIPLEEEKDQKAVNIMPKGRQNFKPTLLSLDWLNEHLYILGEVEADSQRYYQIARCDLDGNGFVVAIAGLQRRPSCIEVDSFNGYLFWTVNGKSSVSGLFSLDLADISNGVKHEDRPSHMIVGKNVGAFVVAHKSYRLLVPFQDNNTIISMTIKG
jgi:proto-oncogene tyrosine-protein kinase ROS